MDPSDPLQLNVDVDVQSLLLASAHHDLKAVKELLKTVPATVQDPDTGFTPLHAAIAACDPEADDQANEEISEMTVEELETYRRKEVHEAAEIVRLLLANGAIWNDLDKNNETPGDIAYRLHQPELYELMVDAGVRAEVLLTRLGEYQPLGDDDDDEDDEDEEALPNFVHKSTNGAVEHPSLHVQESSSTTQDVFPASDNPNRAPVAADPSASNEGYLRDRLSFTNTTLLDSAAEGVMMSWETPIMERHAELLLPNRELRILNVGHGLGIIDTKFQEKSPKAHHIIEAHPDVLSKMREDKWHEKPGVVIHEGRWQDVLPKLMEQQSADGEEAVFDAIFFDTFAEEYSALKEFFQEWAIQLLDSSGRLSFFNGLGADRQICYDVYCRIAEMDLFEAGFDTEWEEIQIPDLQASGEWTGVRRAYWTLQTYKLPICRFVG